MYDLLRANGLRSYGGRPLALGEEFIVESKFTHALLALGVATLVKRDVEPAANPRKTPRSKRNYRTRHLTAEH